MIMRLPVSGAFFIYFMLSVSGSAWGSGPASLADDLSVGSLREAVGHSIDYLRGQPSERMVKICNGLYDTGWLLGSLESFDGLLSQYHGQGREFENQVRQQFEICAAADQKGLMVTGYYEPEVAGSLTRSAKYRYPLYAIPDDLVYRNGRAGRMHKGKFVPYWSRREIEQGGKLKGKELAYLADPIDCFIIHVQGSGRIRFPDGFIRRVHFAAKNGRTYKSIGRLLADTGKMRLEEVTMPSIREYLDAHPKEIADILQHNESYIFFRWGEKGRTPAGSLGKPLTEGRSVALDRRFYPAGALGYLVSDKPVLDENGLITAWQPMTRFVLNQDSGSAITGGNRLDLFWGGDHYAEIAAGNMKQPGKLYFLIKKHQR